MVGREDEVSVQADAYIDALLASHGGMPVALPHAEALPKGDLRRTIELLESSMPRFHPSFRFEERLATQLRAAAAYGTSTSSSISAAEITQLPVSAELTALPDLAGIDRRLILGGAIASGVSLAGAAMLVRAAQRRGRGRPPFEWLS